MPTSTGGFAVGQRRSSSPQEAADHLWQLRKAVPARLTSFALLCPWFPKLDGSAANKKEPSGALALGTCEESNHGGNVGWIPIVKAAVSRGTGRFRHSD